jgi:uncharacterized membrane protein
MKAALKIIMMIALILYPFLVYAGLTVWDPLWVLCGVVMVLCARLALKATAPERLLMLGVIAGLLMVSIFTNTLLGIKTYPVLMNLGFLGLFAFSLIRPPTVVERLARLQEPDLPESGVRYTRTVTQVWCGFFIVNAAISAWTALYADQATWALYNGLIAYGLMGTLMSAEWLVRRKVKQRHARV